MSEQGTVLATATRDIHIHTSPPFRAPAEKVPHPDRYEQSTQDIWAQIVQAVREVCASASLDPRQVLGMGFDATCSLVAMDGGDNAQNVSPPTTLHATHDIPASANYHPCHQHERPVWGRGERNVMLWRDLRAAEDAEEITRTGHPALQFTGGSMGAEMILPRLRWLGRHMHPKEFAQSQFFLLHDWLTWRATGSKARSQGGLVASGMGYVPTVASRSLGRACNDGPISSSPSSSHSQVARPDQDLFRDVGLGSLVHSRFRSLGGIPGEPESEVVLYAGLPVGRGLTAVAAEELGLIPGTHVGSGVIDGYAGWIGTVGAGGQQSDLQSSRHRLAVVAGTSTCMDIQSPVPVRVPGVWGPWDVVFPGMYMSEGGQPAAGALLDHILSTHPAYGLLAQSQPDRQAEAGATDAIQSGQDDGGEPVKADPHSIVLSRLEELVSASGGADRVGEFLKLIRDRALYPDFAGNRAPMGLDSMTGMVSGLRLDGSVRDLCLWYLCALEGLVLQVRHVVEVLAEAGHDIRLLVLSGGLGGNPLFSRLLAHATRTPVALPPVSSVAVPLGSAILGRYAAQCAGELAQPDNDNPLRGSSSFPSSYPSPACSNPLQRQAQANTLAQKGAPRLWALITSMTPAGPVVQPEVSAEDGRLLDAKYRVFLDMVAAQQRWRTALSQLE